MKPKRAHCNTKISDQYTFFALWCSAVRCGSYACQAPGTLVMIGRNLIWTIFLILPGGKFDALSIV
ncbi:hypothetical protein T01_8456 [Trichinella spiralis]|uniref:Uncharacterized protein n=1 Tax=Trichinella spiralis TaxID=6334 RepID=A0A0V1AXY0_TRISP|nr:hypothetical protein T01_8456 [Trichinella spiralis]